MSPNLLVSDFVSYLKKALLACRISHFEQGFALLRAANEAYAYDLDFSQIARVWQGGCIIRNALLGEIQTHFEQSSASLYEATALQPHLKESHSSWKQVVSLAAMQSIPSLAISNALTHFEAYHQARGSANFIQGLRDRFGSHGYERIDKEGHFHTQWNPRS